MDTTAAVSKLDRVPIRIRCFHQGKESKVSYRERIFRDPLFVAPINEISLELLDRRVISLRFFPRVLGRKKKIVLFFS